MNEVPPTPPAPSPEPAPMDAPGPGPIQTKGGNKGIVIGIAVAGIVLLIAIFVGGVLLVLNSSSDDEKSDKKSSKSVRSKGRETTTTEEEKEDTATQEFSDQVTVLNALDGPFPPFKSENNDPAIGRDMPSFVAGDFYGDSQLIFPKSGPYMLVFLAHWCPHCQKEVPKIVELVDDGKIPSDVKLIAIATGSSDQKINFPPSEWLEDEDWPGMALADTRDFELAEEFGLTSYPYVIYVDSEGIVTARTAGEIDEDDIVAHARKISEE